MTTDYWSSEGNDYMEKINRVFHQKDNKYILVDLKPGVYDEKLKSNFDISLSKFEITRILQRLHVDLTARRNDKWLLVDRGDGHSSIENNRHKKIWKKIVKVAISQVIKVPKR